MSQRYEIKERIGRGGIGAIYRAQDTIMGREVAIKRLLPLDQTHLNESADESLQREAAALARFQHPNILTIFAFESDDEGPYVVMELLQGENLKEVIKRGALTLEDFDDLVMQSLDPLIAAQQMNLLHRDIKPQNIMLTWLASGRFHIKLLDFGLAKFTQAPSKQTLDQTGSFLGSIDYIAPEQIELEPLDQRTDLYALGCVFYYCLTQRAPFAADSNARTIQNHLNHVTTPVQTLRPDLPAPVANWVMRLISRRPEHRPSNALAAMKEYEQVKTGVTVLSAADLESDAPSVKVMPSPREESPPGTSPTAPPRRIITGPVKRHTQPTRTVTGPVRQASQPIRGLSQPLQGLPSLPKSSVEGSGSGESPLAVPWFHSPLILFGAGGLLLLFLLLFWSGHSSAPAVVPCRYVQISLPGKGALCLVEVIVNSGGRNVAPLGKASQSSTAYGGVPEKAIDRDRDGSVGNSFSHTAENRDQPWWELDLGREYPVESLEICNRTSEGGKYVGRLEGFTLMLLDQSRREVFKKTGNPAPQESVVFAPGVLQSDGLASAPVPPPSPDVLPPPAASPCVNPSTKPVSPALAVQRGLVAHYASADWTIGPDHKTAAAVGQDVLGWGNLAAKSPDHLLIREDPKRAPSLGLVGPDQYPELKGVFRMLHFEPKDTLRTPDRLLGEVLNTSSMTYFLVHRQLAEPRCAVIRFHLDNVNDQIALDWKPDGYSSAMNKGSTRVGTDPKLETADVHSFHLVTMRWTGAKDEQVLAVTLPGHRRIVSTVGDAPHDKLLFSRYNIGHGGNTYDGYLAEWIIYDRALDDVEISEMEKMLYQKYFAP